MMQTAGEMLLSSSWCGAGGILGATYSARPCRLRPLYIRATLAGVFPDSCGETSDDRTPLLAPLFFTE